LIGASLLIRPEEIYRALIEVTAYGPGVIVEALEKNDVMKRLMQIKAEVKK